MLMLRYYQQLSGFARCLVLSMILHGAMALLLSLKRRNIEIAISGSGTVITATLMPANASLPSPPVRSARSLDHPPPSTGNQIPVDPVKKVEKLPAKAEPMPDSRSDASKDLLAKNTPSKSTTAKNLVKGNKPANGSATLPNRAAKHQSADKVSTITGSDAAKKDTKLLKSIEKISKRSEKAELQRSDKQLQSTDLDHFLDNLATLRATDTSSAEGGSISAHQCSQYAAQIKSVIQSKLIKDSRFQGKSCEIALQLAADGVILKAQLRQGDPGVCAAALRAVGMTGSVPKPINEELYERFKNIVISFEL